MWLAKSLPRDRGPRCLSDRRATDNRTGGRSPLPRRSLRTALNRDTGHAGTVLFEAVKNMSGDADRLRVAVEGFLGAVRAA